MTTTATINVKKGTMNSNGTASGASDVSAGKTFPAKGHNNAQGDAQREKGYKGTGKRSKDGVFENKRDQFTRRMEELEAEVAKSRSKLSQLSEQISSIISNESDKGIRGELRTKMQELKAQRSVIEESKIPILNKIKELQQELKSKTEELNATKEKLPYKRTEDIDKKVRDLEHQLESGAVGKLIEEKRMVAEVTKLKKNKKILEALGEEHQVVDQLKREVDATRAKLQEKDRASDAIRDQIRKVAAQLQDLPDDRNARQSKIQGLIAEKEETKKRLDHLQGEKNLCFADFQAAREAHNVWIEQDRLKRDELFKRREIEEEISKLEAEISNLELPPCQDQITECGNLQYYLKVNILKLPLDTCGPAPCSNGHSSTNASVPQVLNVRKVEKDDYVVMKTKLNKSSRENDSLYLLEDQVSSKNKTQKKQATSTNTGSLKLPFWVIAGLEELGVGIVTTVQEVEAAVAKLDQAKRDFEKKQQDQLKQVDDKRSVIQQKLDQQKKRLDNIAAEVAEARAKAAAEAPTKPKETNTASKPSKEQRQQSSWKNKSAVPASQPVEVVAGTTS
jgi:chromosome segregation ATPase